MVSKIAVMALVALVAAPIMLGFALNLTQVATTEYTETGDPVNVTQLLQNGTSYTYASADPHRLNTKFQYGNSSLVTDFIPRYESITTTSSSMPLSYTEYANQSWAGASQPLTYDYFYEVFDYSVSQTYLDADLYAMVNGVESMIYDADTIHSIYYDSSTGNYSITKYNSSGYVYVAKTGTAQLTRMTLTTTVGSVDRVIVALSGTGRYADLSAGFRFDMPPESNPYNGPYMMGRAILPDYTKSYIVSVDLSSVTDSTYSFQIASFVFNKTTTGGIVNWTVTPYNQDPIDLYYNQGSLNNTYQLKYDTNPFNGLNIGSGIYSFPYTAQLRYVGAWPEYIGESNYYQSYTMEGTVRQTGGGSTLNLNVISFRSSTALSPIFRIDAAEFRAFEYPVLDNITYQPADFKTNPSTTISDVTGYGSSITFAGNTYTVSKGNITLGSHQVPVNGIVLSSVPNPSGGYDNKIGNTIISTTAQPSAIAFNGKWAAAVSTVAQESTSVTKTQWIPGQFAWDGMDDNFLMVGLITCLGVFILGGIYARSHRMSIWPLLLVCGGAAALFIFMI